jgi:glycosyltransferase involved in cell wall biosynthesis
MTKRIKPVILILENSVSVTGALKSIVLSSLKMKDEFDFIFILPQKSSGKQFVEEHGFEVVFLNMIEIRKKPLPLLLYVPMLIKNVFVLRSLVRRRTVSLIVNNDFYNIIPPVYTSLGGNVPYICYVRFLPVKFPTSLVRFWNRLHFRHAKKIVAVSEAVKEQLPGSEKVLVIHNELPNHPVPYAESSSTIILYCANYIPGKGHEHALKGFAAIAQQYPEWKLRFVGGDMDLEKNKRYKNDLIKMASDLGLISQVIWDSFVANVAEAYQGSSFVLNFSESESFSMTCLEALYYGRPVVATKSGGPSEIIDHEQTGLLVDLGNITAITTAIRYLIDNHKQREIMGKRGYLSVRDNFSYDKTIEKLRSVYQSII